MNTFSKISKVSKTYLDIREKFVNILFLFIFISLAIAGCGGGGGESGTPYYPVNPDNKDLTISGLYTSKNVANLNSHVIVMAKVINKFGMGVAGEKLTFNINGDGKIVENSSNSIVTTTNSYGESYIRVTKSNAGNITVSVTGENISGIFTTNTITFANMIYNDVFMNIDVDTNNNLVFNEDDDFTLFSKYKRVKKEKKENGSGGMINFVVSLKNAYGNGIADKKIFIKGKESDFITYEPSNKFAITNKNGQAVFNVNIDTDIINNEYLSYLTFDFYSYDVDGKIISKSITLTVYPVSIGYINAVPNKFYASISDKVDVKVTSFNKDGKAVKKGYLNIVSKIKEPESLKDSTCGIVPDGVVITDGVGDFVFYTPAALPDDISQIKCEITVSYNKSVKKSFIIEINKGIAGTIGEDLTVIPANATINIGQMSRFIVYGGYPPFYIVNTNSSVVTASEVRNNEFTVYGIKEGTADILLSDAKGKIVKVEITVTKSAISIIPDSFTVKPGSDDLVALISGGAGRNYTAISSMPSIIPNPTISSQNIMTIKVPSVSPDAIVVIIVKDNLGNTGTVTVTITNDVQ